MRGTLAESNVRVIASISTVTTGRVSLISAAPSFSEAPSLLVFSGAPSVDRYPVGGQVANSPKEDFHLSARLAC